MAYRVIPVTPFQQNCTLFWCPETREAAIVDPGGDIDKILGAVQEEGVHVTQILLTHGHIDHAGATADLAEQLKVPVLGPQKEDQFWIDALDEQSVRFGFQHAQSFTPDRWLEDGDQIQVGKLTFSVIHCPGHTPGHVVFVDKESGVAQVGDVLFQGSIGRTDFPRGDYSTLIHSIKEKLFPLGDNIRFIPGHGPESTFGYERKTNPFLAGQWG